MGLQEEKQQLQEKNVDLEEENAGLQEEKQQLQEKNVDLEEKNAGLQEEKQIGPPQVYYEVSLEIKNRVLKEYSEWLNAHCLNLLKLPGFIDINLVEVEEAAKPTVIFVLGVPGAGKAPQCGKISETFGYQHISAGDCL